MENEDRSQFLPDQWKAYISRVSSYSKLLGRAIPQRCGKIETTTTNSISRPKYGELLDYPHKTHEKQNPLLQAKSRKLNSNILLNNFLLSYSTEA